MVRKWGDGRRLDVLFVLVYVATLVVFALVTRSNLNNQIERNCEAINDTKLSITIAINESVKARIASNSPDAEEFQRRLGAVVRNRLQPEVCS